MFFIVVAASAQTGLCPAPNGDFANPSSEQCTTFFRCSQGNPALLRCPSNQRFDFLFRICRQQRLVDCNNQLQVFAAPSAAAGLGGINNGIGALAGNGGFAGLGALGGIAGSQLGAGLPNGGLLTLLSQMGGANGDGQNGSNNLASILLMSALMNKRNTGNQPNSPPPFPGAPPAIYPATNVLNSAVLPADQINNQNWQQSVGAYTPNGAGTNSGSPITMPDGRTYLLVPQYGPTLSQGNFLQGDGQNQLAGLLPGIPPAQYPGVLQTSFQGQNALLGQMVLPGQSSVSDNTGSKEIGQPNLQNTPTKPNTETKNDLDSSSATTTNSSQ